MLLLVDENVPQSVADFLASRGHDVRLVRELLPAQTPDQVVAIVGDALAAIIVTWDKDLRRLAARMPLGSQGRFRRLGRISFRCRESRGLQRIKEVIESLEFEYAQVQKRADKRLIVVVTETSFSVNR